jgi:cation diffusion facilitator CzcD-associated flavoprotein CzcO
MSDSRPDYHCLIVGAGFSGIGVAIKLDAEGFGDYLIVEDADDVGATWYWNTYPGIAVDIPSFSYQFSFEQRPDWSRTYARGNELKAYADYCADKYSIRPKIRFSTKVLGVEFDEERALWRVQLDPGGEITARFVVNASGVLTVPKPPDIDGVDSFAGLVGQGVSAELIAAKWKLDRGELDAFSARSHALAAAAAAGRDPQLAHQAEA